MISNLISIVTTAVKGGIAPIIYVWNFMTSLWENETNNWED